MAFNSEEYGWNDLSTTLGGRVLIGFTGIKYKEKQDKKNVYGKGKKPIRRARGRVEFEGELKVLQSELRQLLKDAGNGRSIVSIRPFDIVNSFAPEAGGKVTTDILKYVEFLEMEIDINEGDPNTEHTLPIIIGDIQWSI